MRRWNGWGDDATDYPVPEGGRRALVERLGHATPPGGVTLAETVATVPASRLPDHPLLSDDAELRVRRAVGQSLPDWVRIRQGRVDRWPDAVARPASAEDVVEVLRLGRETGALVLPWGGGTSVVGHLTLQDPDRPAILCSMERMTDLVDLDEAGGLATFQAGVAGPAVERALGARGFTLGHYPQSWELSTLGGWVATRSSGQLSRRYGRIEDLLVGAHVQTPSGPLDLLPVPASAAGPDLRHLVLGSEGRLGVITDCQVKVRRVPEVETFRGAFFRDQARAVAAVRALAQAGVDLNMVRLSLPDETETNLAMSSHGRTGQLLEGYLGLRRVGEGRCMVLYGASGGASHVRHTLHEASAVLHAHGAVRLGKPAGDAWEKGRFRFPYLRNGLWEAGYAADTLETAVLWREIPGLVDDLHVALRGALAGDGERVHPFTHLSHMYPHGTSVYCSYVFRAAADPDVTLDRWRRCKAAASDVLVAHGGTISHQHGVGHDHRPWLEAEKGPLGLELMRAAFRTADPDGLLASGNLVTP